MKAKAITNPGKINPTKGTRIEGKYAAVIIRKLRLFYKKLHYIYIL